MVEELEPLRNEAAIRVFDGMRLVLPDAGYVSTEAGYQLLGVAYDAGSQQFYTLEKDYVYFSSSRYDTVLSPISPEEVKEATIALLKQYPWKIEKDMLVTLGELEVVDAMFIENAISIQDLTTTLYTVREYYNDDFPYHYGKNREEESERLIFNEKLPIVFVQDQFPELFEEIEKSTIVTEENRYIAPKESRETLDFSSNDPEVIKNAMLEMLRDAPSHMDEKTIAELVERQIVDHSFGKNVKVIQDLAITLEHIHHFKQDFPNEAILFLEEKREDELRKIARPPIITTEMPYADLTWEAQRSERGYVVSHIAYDGEVQYVDYDTERTVDSGRAGAPDEKERIKILQVLRREDSEDIDAGELVGYRGVRQAGDGRDEPYFCTEIFPYDSQVINAAREAIYPPIIIAEELPEPEVSIYSSLSDKMKAVLLKENEKMVAECDKATTVIQQLNLEKDVAFTTQDIITALIEQKIPVETRIIVTNIMSQAGIEDSESFYLQNVINKIQTLKEETTQAVSEINEAITSKVEATEGHSTNQPKQLATQLG